MTLFFAAVRLSVFPLLVAAHRQQRAEVLVLARFTWIAAGEARQGVRRRSGAVPMTLLSCQRRDHTGRCQFS